MGGATGTRPDTSYSIAESCSVDFATLLHCRLFSCNIHTYHLTYGLLIVLWQDIFYES